MGLTFRFHYGAELVQNKKIKFEFAPDDFINMKKLAEGALDAFVVEERSGVNAMQLMGVKNITFDKSVPVSTQDVYYAFHDTLEGKRIAKIFSRAIQEMRGSGDLRKIITE